ncbi:unnamed protein product [Cylindrotheca closterium]|uniref:Uncharacterized protein n=1 Tax=Cylindrotheca closterium TaxID=2856 RepID=A0AAD2FJM8_9STRA|nr:unnamed protein product [Cylindrotheca closterium]
MKTRLEIEDRISSPYANPESYLLKRRSANRAKRRREILDFVDAALYPEQASRKSSLLNDWIDDTDTEEIIQTSQGSIFFSNSAEKQEQTHLVYPVSDNDHEEPDEKLPDEHDTNYVYEEEGEEDDDDGAWMSSRYVMPKSHRAKSAEKQEQTHVVDSVSDNDHEEPDEKLPDEHDKNYVYEEEGEEDDDDGTWMLSRYVMPKSHRAKRRREILYHVDAALHPEKASREALLLNHRRDEMDIRRSSQVSSINMAGIICDNYAAKEEDIFASISDDNHEPGEKSPEDEHDTNFDCEGDDDEESILYEESEPSMYDENIVFEQEQDVSSSSFLDDDADDFLYIISGSCEEEELFFRVEEDIIYESEDDLEEIILAQDPLETIVETGEEESDQESTGFDEAVDDVETSDLLVTIVEEDIERDDDFFQERILYESDLQSILKPETKDEPGGTERISFVTACETLEADEISVEYSIEEIILFDDEDPSYSAARTFIHETIEYEASESSIDEFWQEPEQPESPQDCSNSSFWLSANGTFGHGISELSIDVNGEEILCQPDVSKIGDKAIEHRPSEASFEETNPVYDSGNGAKEPLTGSDDGNITDKTDDDIMWSDSESCGWDTYSQADLLAEYEEDARFQFPVPQIPVLKLWQHNHRNTQIQTVNQEVEENGYCKSIDALEAATRTPRNILIAILAQGDLQFKLRKVPVEHKNEYKPIAQSASSIGRLTRLQEQVIESISLDDNSSSQEAEQFVPRKSPLANTRSSGQRLSIEAAALGKIVRRQEEYFTNWDEEEEGNESLTNETVFSKNTDVFERRISIDDARDDRGMLVQRTSLLIHHHVRDSRIANMEKDWAMEEFLEDEEKYSNNNHELDLPKMSLPKFQLPKSERRLSREEMIESLAKGVAEKSWERKYRLERPGAQLRMHTGCTCVYCCKNKPSQSQTHQHCYNVVTSCTGNGMEEERTPPSPLEQDSKPKVALDWSCAFNGFS